MLICALRLRQAVAHPFLLEELMKTVFGLKDIEWLTEQLKTIQTKTPFINQIGRWCEEKLKLAQTASADKNQSLATGFDLLPTLERVRKLQEAIIEGRCRRCGTIADSPFKPEVRASTPSPTLIGSRQPY